ncbi:MAG TPA: hypothetical protein VN310_12060 [Candidatus Dormibacteraeota bacterium]|jgi:hypothetical protein|nr:hypothetical protein [Candidatus Dormibacteraeota bacterium]
MRFEVAKLTVYLAHAYDTEKDTETTRFRISSTTLRNISLRTRLRDTFIIEWQDALSYEGWAVFPIGEHFGLIRTNVIAGWRRISSRRVADKVEGLRAGDQSVMTEISSDLGHGRRKRAKRKRVA